MNRGKYIVLEGPQGVGKTTQLRELSRRLRSAGFSVRTFREPDSTSDVTARAIRRITQNPQLPINTRSEVLLYNAARAQSLQIIKHSVEQGIICLADRNYLTTLAIQYYGRGDVADYQLINTIINFAVNGVEPDLCIMLDAPAQLLRGRASQRGHGERFDQLDEAFLERVRAGYLWEAKQRGLPVVFTSQDQSDVAAEIWKLTAQALSAKDTSAVEEPAIEQADSKKPQTQASTYYLPSNLSKDLEQEYRQALDSILHNHALIHHKIVSYLSADSTADQQAKALSQMVLPISSLSENNRLVGTSHVPDFIHKLTTQLPATHGLSSEQSVQLYDYWPRNELAALIDIVYPYSNQTSDAIAQTIQKLSYEAKAETLHKYTAQSQTLRPAFDKIRYSFDIVSSYQLMHSMRQIIEPVLLLQPLSPRNGYEVPDVIEAAGASELLEDCFDTSLILYSRMHAAGHLQEAQYAVLQGTRVRYQLTCTANQLLLLATTPDYKKITSALVAQIATVHPLLAEQIQ